MKNYINGIYGNKMSLFGNNKYAAEDVCDRFVSYVTNLSEKEQIALQFIPNKDGICLTTVTDNKTSYSREDINWIFKDYAEAGDITKPKFAKEGCKIYALAPKEDNGRKYRYGFEDDYDDRGMNLGFVQELFSEMIRSGIILQINACVKKQASGRILLSIKGGITARQKALLSLVFKDLNVVSLSEIYEDECDIPANRISFYMYYLLRAMHDDLKKQKESSHPEEIISPADIFTSGLVEADEWGEICDDDEDDTEEEPDDSETKTVAKSSLTLLDELIGLEDVKEQVKKIVAYARMKKAMDESNTGNLSMALNMVFTGNPGTAKTTVARILAGIFYEIGLLRSSEIVEAGRADLIGSYLGQTAPKVVDVFKKASGKLLFIDEAYSLVDADKSSYSDEAISAIVQEMENRRNKTIVIFAGYPDKMESFFEMNPGLRSRVPFTVEFKNYPVETLVEIAETEAAKRGFSICEGAVEKVRLLCTEASANPEFGNGRFCRNLIENAILNYAFRNFSQESDRALPESLELIEEDFTMPQGLMKMQREKKFGFT